jgi:hypothetical protein
MKSEKETIAKFVDYIKKCGGNFQEWYIDIASDVEKSLFDEHIVDRGSKWIQADCGSEESAREIVRYFIDNYDMQGGGGGGDASTTYIYAYEISLYTVE